MLSTPIVGLIWQVKPINGLLAIFRLLRKGALEITGSQRPSMPCKANKSLHIAATISASDFQQRLHLIYAEVFPGVHMFTSK